MPSLDPSRPLSCIPLRASLRRLCAHRYEEAARDARDSAHSARRMVRRVADPHWRDIYVVSAREADARAAACDSMAARWLA